MWLCCCNKCPPNVSDRCIPHGESNSPCTTGTPPFDDLPSSYSVYLSLSTPFAGGGDHAPNIPGTYERPLGNAYCKWFNVDQGSIGDPFTPYLEFGDFGDVHSPVRIVVPEPPEGSGAESPEYFAVYYPREYIEGTDCPRYKRLEYHPLCSHPFAFSEDDSNLSGNYYFETCLCAHPGRRCCDEEFTGSYPIPDTLDATLEYCWDPGGGVALQTVEFQLTWDADQGYWIGTAEGVYYSGSMTKDYSFILACGTSEAINTTGGDRAEFDVSATCSDDRPTPPDMGCACLNIYTGEIPSSGPILYNDYAYGAVEGDFDTCVCEPLEIEVLNNGLFSGAYDCTTSPPPTYNEKLTILEP